MDEPFSYYEKSRRAYTTLDSKFVTTSSLSVPQRPSAEETTDLMLHAQPKYRNFGETYHLLVLYLAVSDHTMGVPNLLLSLFSFRNS